MDKEPSTGSIALKLKKSILLNQIYPVRMPVKWYYRGERVVLEYPKNFTRFERFLHRYLGGPTTIKRPLDEVGSSIWILCDGEHSLAEIIYLVGERFKERVEPADKVVDSFIEILLKLNLIRLEKPKKKGAKKVVLRGVKSED
ncbi:MAG: PqqD family protein [Thermoplasmata archaeon]|nr:PqqD family protein [Thermoplasmata archaeon]OYT50268.1 MAG: hypothetical protein B6U83_00510 [Thermoplasmatales archaeon ex4484_36]HDD59488.1 PqqD family protein [Euryarchaeota archaeon]RLF55062.1 MAG: hypothetical protein DRN28_04145 [Thermoplasmata archaeon]RLF70054.1 MAG: hypothetical protein DRN35_04955 [Thermoplasmata archaeon]